MVEDAASGVLTEPEWRTEGEPVAYADALAAMERRVDAISRGEARELIWLLEHPHVVTAGTSARPDELRQPERFPIFQAGRGGRYTYHGPGQRLVYVMLDLTRRGRDVRCFVAALEKWVISALEDLGVAAFTSSAGTGIWVQTPAGEAKIGAIGVRVRRWVTFHGFSVNVSTDLDAYGAIVPCGIADRGVARLCDLRPAVGMKMLDEALHGRLPQFLNSLSVCSLADGGTQADPAQFS